MEKPAAEKPPEPRAGIAIAPSHLPDAAEEKLELVAAQWLMREEDPDWETVDEIASRQIESDLPAARIFATHTHVDHSPATASLLQHRRVEVVGAVPGDNMFQDALFKPDVECRHDQVFDTDEYSLRALATPGHVSNHFCFLEENSGLMMTGDHIMNGSTVVIVPPSGDMAAYIRSLQCLVIFLNDSAMSGLGISSAHPRVILRSG